MVRLRARGESTGLLVPTGRQWRASQHVFGETHLVREKYWRQAAAAAAERQCLDRQSILAPGAGPKSGYLTISHRQAPTRLRARQPRVAAPPICFRLGFRCDVAHSCLPCRDFRGADPFRASRLFWHTTSETGCDLAALLFQAEISCGVSNYSFPPAFTEAGWSRTVARAARQSFMQ